MDIENETQQEAPSTQARLQLVRNIARALNSTNNAIQLYPAESPMPREAAGSFLAALERYLMFEPYLQLSVSGDTLCLEEEDICGQSTSLKRFAFQLHSRQVGQVRFMPELAADECVTFLRVLAVDPETLKAKGGLARVLAAKGVRHVLVVDLAQEAAAEGGPGELRDDTKRVAGVAGLRAEMLVEASSDATVAWLRESADEIAGRDLCSEERAGELARVLSEGAGIAAGFDGTLHDRAMDNLASAVVSLDTAARRELLSVLLNTKDGGAGALQAILARIDDEELAGSLAEAAQKAGAEPASFATTDGLDEERRQRIIEQAGQFKAPQSEAAEPARDERHAMAPQLPRYSRRGDDVQFSPTQLATEARQFTQDERDGLLQAPHEANAEESLRSATTLLYLLNRASQETSAAETVDSIVRLAEHSLAQGHVAVLVRLVCGLRLKQERCDPASPLAQKIDQSMNVLSSPEVAASVVRLLADGRPDRLEAATEYFMSAHSVAQEAVIEVFGTDASQELKRQIGAIFSRLGARAIGVTERHVSDSRWPVALYCVEILGGIGEPRVVPALRRALSHDEPRVVEQAIRALGQIGGREAEEALALAIEHGAGRGRLLAIQAAGAAQAQQAVEPLQSLIAEGDAFGRSLEEKLAAVNALGAIGTSQAITALREADRKRFLFSPGKTAQLREAARGHLERLTTE